MKFADLKCEWTQVMRGLESFATGRGGFQDKRFVLRATYQRGFSGTAGDRSRRTPTLRELS
jgi:hypothetical protein